MLTRDKRRKLLHISHIVFHERVSARNAETRDINRVQEGRGRAKAQKIGGGG